MSTRRRGEGSIYRRGRIYWVKYFVRGRSYRESAGSQSERDAVKLLRRRLLELQAGHHAPEADRLGLDALLQFVEEDYRLNARRSLARVQAAFAHLREMNFWDGLKFASTAAALSIEKRGARTSIPTLIQVEEAFANG